MVAVIKAEIGLARVMIGSNSAYVIEMESIPDSGVDTRKAVVAPLFAPCFLSAAPAGRTPQDHNGIGIPNRAALNTGRNLPRPRLRATYFGLRNILRNPATIKPKRM
jgi:hypothetical protein